MKRAQLATEKRHQQKLATQQERHQKELAEVKATSRELAVIQYRGEQLIKAVEADEVEKKKPLIRKLYSKAYNNATSPTNWVNTLVCAIIVFINRIVSAMCYFRLNSLQNEFIRNSLIIVLCWLKLIKWRRFRESSLLASDIFYVDNDLQRFSFDQHWRRCNTSDWPWDTSYGGRL